MSIACSPLNLLETRSQLRTLTLPLIADLKAGGSGAGDGVENRPPQATVPGITKIWAKMFQDMKTKYEAAVIDRKKAELAAQGSQDAAAAAKAVSMRGRGPDRGGQC